MKYFVKNCLDLNCNSAAKSMKQTHYNTNSSNTELDQVKKHEHSHMTYVAYQYISQESQKKHDTESSIKNQPGSNEVISLENSESP